MLRFIGAVTVVVVGAFLLMYAGWRLAEQTLRDHHHGECIRYLQDGT